MAEEILRVFPTFPNKILKFSSTEKKSDKNE